MSTSGYSPQTQNKVIWVCKAIHLVPNESLEREGGQSVAGLVIL